WIYLAAIIGGLLLGGAVPRIAPVLESLLWPALALLLYATFVQVAAAASARRLSRSSFCRGGLGRQLRHPACAGLGAAGMVAERSGGPAWRALGSVSAVHRLVHHLQSTRWRRRTPRHCGHAGQPSSPTTAAAGLSVAHARQRAGGGARSSPNLARAAGGSRADDRRGRVGTMDRGAPGADHRAGPAGMVAGTAVGSCRVLDCRSTGPGGS